MNKKKSFVLRTVALFLAMTAIAVLLITRLVEVQLLAAPEAETRSNTLTRTYSVAAARGEILDREGRPLVSNVLGFNVELDYYEWDRENQNDIILRLCAILDAGGLSHSDDLPMTAMPPYTYTFAGWDSVAGTKLQKLIAEQKGWPERPSAPELMGLLCQKYNVAQDLLLQDKRTIVGVRYFLDLYQFSSYNNMAVLARDVGIATVAKISEKSLQLPGVTIAEANLRRYETDYAAHILGRVAVISAEEYAELKNAPVPYKMTDTLGKDGMEKALEDYLRGLGGKEAWTISKTTGEILQVATLPDEAAAPGSHCYLTIDLELQKVAERVLPLGLEQVRLRGEASKDGKGADVEGGALVVINAKTLEVLAMASYPTFDLRTYTFDEAFAEMAPYLNRTVQAVYPPGSTFKMATAVAALESGVTTTTEKIRDAGRYQRFDDYQPACWIYNQRGGSHGNINISEALAYSCNYFFYEVADRMRIDVLREHASALGLGQKTGIELPGEKAGTLDGPETRVQSINPWHPGNLLSVAIGQGANQFSPLQLASYMATILNGGTRMEAHLLKKVVDYTGQNILFEQQPVVLQDTPLKDSTVEAIKKGMFGVVTDDGTASSYFRNFPASIGVGGKTGSAETYGDRSAHGVFISFAPYDDPEIIVVAIGEYAGTGGSMAPVCIEIYNHYFGLQIPVGLITQPADTTKPAPPVTPPATIIPTAPSTSEPEAETPETATEPIEGIESAPETEAEPFTESADGAASDETEPAVSGEGEEE